MCRTCNIHFLRNIVHETRRKRIGKSFNRVMWNVYQGVCVYVLYTFLYMFICGWVQNMAV
jgi:hypothetical protein